MKNFICCSLTAIFLILDMLAGNLSLFPAFGVYCAIVLFLAYNWKYGIVSAAASGMVLDAVYGHNFSYLSLIFLCAVLVGALIADRGHRQILALLAAGAAAGITVSTGVIIAVKFSGGMLPAPDRITYLFSSAAGGGLWLLFSAAVFDFFAVRANLPRCVKSVFSTSPRQPRRPVSRSAQNNSSRRYRR